MKKIKLTAILLAFLCVLTACGTSEGNGNAQDAEESPNGETEQTPDAEESVNGEMEQTPMNADGNSGGQRGGGPGGGGRGGMTTANDPEIQSVLDENAGKFEQRTFTDPDTADVLEYSLYIPDGYDDSAAYPLLMFIPDSTGAGKNAKEIVEQYYGAAVWVTEDDQGKHPSFVVVPAFTETVVDDDWNVSAQVETAVSLLRELQETYSIDANRIYATGQSMGCMTSLYLNSKYPDLFAASVFVSGQWEISALKPLENQKFFVTIQSRGERAENGKYTESLQKIHTDFTNL